MYKINKMIRTSKLLSILVLSIIFSSANAQMLHIVFTQNYRDCADCKFIEQQFKGQIDPEDRNISFHSFIDYDRDEIEKKFNSGDIIIEFIPKVNSTQVELAMKIREKKHSINKVSRMFFANITDCCDWFIKYAMDFKYPFNPSTWRDLITIEGFNNPPSKEFSKTLARHLIKHPKFIFLHTQVNDHAKSLSSIMFLSGEIHPLGSGCKIKIYVNDQVPSYIPSIDCKYRDDRNVAISISEKLMRITDWQP